MKFHNPLVAVLGILAIVLPLTLANRENVTVSANEIQSRFSSSPGRGAAVVPAGTKIHIRLEDPVSSDRNSSQDFFRAFLDRPLVEGGKVLAPSGSKVLGKLITVNHPSRAGGSASLTMVVEKLTVDGKKYSLETQPLTFSRHSDARSEAKDTQARPGKALLRRKGGSTANTREMLAAQSSPVAFGPESRFAFSLAHELTLPTNR